MKTLPLSEVLTKVTPLPWRKSATSPQIFCAETVGDYPVAVGHFYTPAISNDERHANALFAAHAANVLPECVAMLEMAERCLAMGPDVDPLVAFAALEKLRAFLPRASAVPV